MFNLDSAKAKKESPFTKLKSSNIQNKEVVENHYNNFIKENTEVIYTREMIRDNFNLDSFLNLMYNSQNVNGFVKLLTVKIDDRIKKLIKNTIDGRDLVVELNSLPSYMVRQNPEAISIKSVGTEATFSDCLRTMNKGYTVKLQTPALNTLTPEKDRPDYILENKCKIIFDMKGQVVGKAININKKAHDRAIEQGLTFYIIGITNSEEYIDLNTITYYLLPLDYFHSKALFIDKGKYGDNPNNHYYSIKLENIVNVDKVALNIKLKEKIPANPFKNIHKI